LYWCFIVPLYWATVVTVLRNTSPVSGDGSGPSPTFYWGKHPPAPGLLEYSSNRTHFDSVFNMPYYVAGLVITVVGCGIGPRIGKALAKRVWPRFAITLAATLTTLLLVAALSDLGGRWGWWAGPRILGAYHGYPDILVLPKVLLLPSILSGAVAYCRDLVAPSQRIGC
jgi:hypothetical protein